MTTESESRMREVLESRVEELVKIACVKEANDAIEARREFNHTNCVRNAVRMTISEALSPPARRTSYEFERELLLLRLRSAIADKEWVTACANMETEHRDGWSCDWHTGMREAHNEIESIIATLAGLEKEEEPRVTSVRISLAKHGLIDKISPSGDEIERTCRSSDPWEDAS